MNDEDAPGVTPKASAPAPPEVAATSRGASEEEAPAPSAHPQVETKPKRRAKTKAIRAGGDLSESRVEAEPPDVKEGKEVKEGKKRRKRRSTEAKEEEAEVKPEGEVPIDDQAALIATVEELAPVPEEGPPKRRRKRKKHPPEESAVKEPSNGEMDHPEVNNARYGELIRGVYQRHNPAKLNEVESLLQKYEGMEAELYHRVCEKYQEKPQDVDGEDGDAGGASAAKAPPSRVMAGEAWPFEEDEVSVNSESSSSEAAPGSNQPEEPPKNSLPAVSGIFDVDNKSPSSPSSKRSHPGDDLMQRFTSLTEPKAPGNGAEIPRGDVAPPRPLPAWAFAPVAPERPEQTNGRVPPQEPAIPAWALPEDAPPGDWGRRYPPSYPGRGAPGPGPPGWSGKGWGYPSGYAALPVQAAPGRSWADNIGSAWAQ